MSQPEPGYPLISIIDDDPAIRSSLVDLMEAAGYDAVSFAGAEAFLASKERSLASCIITDIQMPGVDGFELKRRLDQGRSVAPVIMITARSDQYPEDRVRESGAFCFLRKPFEAEALLGCVKRSLLAPSSSAYPIKPRY